MQQKQDAAQPQFPHRELEQTCLHSLGLLEQNCEYLHQHLRACGGDDASLQAVDDMQAACVRLDRTLGEMMALHECLYGEAKPENTVFDMGGLLRTLAAQQAAIEKELNVHLCVNEPAEDETYIVCADSEWAEQVCLHLLSNALHACSEGGHVRISLRRNGHEFIFSVLDDGCGLPDGTAQSMLENRRRFLGGAQAGLLLCREYCRRMGWRLELRRQKVGTEAVVTIPEHTAALPRARVELYADDESACRQRALRVARFLAAEAAFRGK